MKLWKIVLLFAAMFASGGGALAHGICQSDPHNTLPALLASDKPWSQFVPRDLTIDQTPYEYQFGEDGGQTSSLPADTKGTQHAGSALSAWFEGRAICRVRDGKGDWWLVLDDIAGGALEYVRQSTVEARPAGPDAWRKAPPASHGRRQRDVSGTWQACGRWAQPNTTCRTNFTLHQKGHRVCGTYLLLRGSALEVQVFEGRLAGHIDGNQIDIDTTCGRPGHLADHDCPSTRTGRNQGEGWDPQDFVLTLCGTMLFDDDVDCASQDAYWGMVRGTHKAPAESREDDEWLAACLDDKNYPPPALRAPQ